MKHIDELNSIDVFPTPSGNAGIQIYLTMWAGCKEIKIKSTSTASEVSVAFARGSLMGARGHQGVPFSQWFRGFARGIGDQTQINASTFTNALMEAAVTTYRSYIEPVEGDLWRVADDTAKIAQQKVSETTNLYDILQCTIDEAQLSVARTTDLIPVLKTTGLVHSGGLAFLYFLNGMKYVLDGKISETMLKDDNFTFQIPGKAG